MSKVLLIFTNHDTVNCECADDSLEIGGYIDPFSEDGEVVEDIQVGEPQKGPLHGYGPLEEGIGVADILPLFGCISSHLRKGTTHTIIGPLPVAGLQEMPHGLHPEDLLVVRHQPEDEFVPILASWAICNIEDPFEHPVGPESRNLFTVEFLQDGKDIGCVVLIHRGYGDKALVKDSVGLM